MVSDLQLKIHLSASVVVDVRSALAAQGFIGIVAPVSYFFGLCIIFVQAKLFVRILMSLMGASYHFVTGK